MAGGGAAGRAAAAGGPGLLCSWADELTLAAATETPRRNAAKRRPGARMIDATCYYSLFGSLVAGHLNARPQQSIGAVIAALRRRVTGEHTRRLCTSPNPVHREIFMLIVIVCMVLMVLWPGMTRWLPPKSKVFRTPIRGA
jgi:hypothetical protein